MHAQPTCMHRQGAHLPGADLARASLPGAHLAGAHLAGYGIPLLAVRRPQLTDMHFPDPDLADMQFAATRRRPGTSRPGRRRGRNAGRAPPPGSGRSRLARTRR